MQKRVFASHPRYGGKYPGARDNQRTSQDETRELVEILMRSQFVSSLKTRKSVARWLERQRFVDENDPSRNDTLLFSNEGLAFWPTSPSWNTRLPIETGRCIESQPRRERPAPICRIVGDYIKPMWDGGRIKILLTLRNQPAWLASLYAQLGNEILWASQRDFEKRVDRLVEQEEPYLDWNGWVEDLVGTIGRENIMVKFVEDSVNADYWTDITAFCGISGGVDSDMTRDRGPRDNVRSRSDGMSWEVRKFDVSKVLANRNRRRLTAKDRTSKKRYVEQVGRIFNRLLDKCGRKSIRLDDRIREQVLSFVSSSNIKLESFAGKNLGEYGYYDAARHFDDGSDGEYDTK